MSTATLDVAAPPQELQRSRELGRCLVGLGGREPIAKSVKDDTCDTLGVVEARPPGFE